MDAINRSDKAATEAPACTSTLELLAPLPFPLETGTLLGLGVFEPFAEVATLPPLFAEVPALPPFAEVPALPPFAEVATLPPFAEVAAFEALVAGVGPADWGLMGFIPWVKPV